MLPFHTTRTIHSPFAYQLNPTKRAYPFHFERVPIWTNPLYPDTIPAVKLSKTREGTLYTRIASLLTGVALLAIFVYQMLYDYVIQYGGTYPSGGILLISWPLLAFGAVFGFYGARMLRSRIALAVPIA